MDMAASNNFNDMLRALVGASYKDGQVVPLSFLNGYAVSGAVRPVLVDLVKLVMLTDFTKPDTKEYLQQRYAGWRSIYVGEGCADNKHTSKSRVTYDLMKLRRVLGEDFFTVALQRGTLDVEQAGKNIRGLLSKATGKSLLDGFAQGLHLPAEPGDNELMFDGDKEVLLEIVRSCSKKGLRSRWSCLTSDMVAYIKFLENTSEDDMDDSDRAVYEQLKLWLG